MNSTEGSVTYLQRPSENLEDGLLAEVHTVKGKRTTLFTAMLEGVQMQDDNQGVDASKFLYRKGRFNASYDVIVLPGSCSDFRPGSRSYHFIGNDGAEYRWKYQKGLGWTVSTLLCLCRVQINLKPINPQLSVCNTGDEIAQQVRWLAEEGVFAGQERSALRINPCLIDIELIVLSFVILEKQRRARISEKVCQSRNLYDDPLDGGASGAEAEAGSLTCSGEA